MKISARWQQGLKWLLLATFASSVLHYIDNLLFFEQYPEPVWINRAIIDGFWFVMTPLALVGYHLMQRGAHQAGTWVLLAYAGCNLLTLGHYRYAYICTVVPRINAFIFLEAVLACLLTIHLILPYVTAMRSRKMTDE
jgi:hypothetical protein